MKLNRRQEYIGWPLNMASRLQGAVSTNYKRPASRVFLTNHAFERLKVNPRIYNTKRVAVSLKNIRDGKKIQVWMVNLIDDKAQRKLIAQFASHSKVNGLFFKPKARIRINESGPLRLVLLGAE